MLGLFNRKPPVDEETVAWMFETWRWALENFDAEVFFNETILVIPSNEYFPGRENSIQGVATLIFEQVRRYAGVSHWPCRLVEAGTPMIASKDVTIAGALRGPGGLPSTPTSESAWLTVPYYPHRVSKPEGMIADYAQILAHYLATMGRVPPPGGESAWPAATEVLGVFMGFGLMFANSAYNYRGGCGSCYNPLAERTPSLSQDEATYALAIFSVLKGVPDNKVLRELKSYLRPVFKRALRDVQAREESLRPLRAMQSLPQG